jgi:F5/8 type C domain-containing protein
MSTFISEPGTRLGGRYRLEDRVSGGNGWSVWKAIDETLARAVTVLTFAPGFHRIGEAVTAARTASRLTDARLAQVFDVEEDWDHAYVVMEWVGGDSLQDLLADGPLDPGQGAEIIAQGAEALAIAHAAGVAHLCLTPGSLRWTAGGGVKIVGLGIDAALSGITHEDPELADTHGLARLLYAALTAHWPGDDWAALPPAPEIDGHPRSPRQVRAGVPAPVDEVACRALLGSAAAGEPLTTPAALAAALTRVIPAPAAPLPAAPFPGFTAGPRPGGRGQDYRGTDYWGRENHQPPPGAWRPREAPQRSHGNGPKTMAVVLSVLVVVALGIGAWTLTHRGGGSRAAASLPTNHPSTVHVSTGPLQPAGAQGFDPLSSVADDSGNENTDQAHAAIDGNPLTAWHTQWYTNAEFGGLKAGTGLMLDMGKPVRLSSVTVTFGATPGADVRIELGNANTRSAATLSQFTTVARKQNVGGMTTFSITRKTSGRYLLIWFTKLPPTSHASQFLAKVANVAVRGTS